jgi:methylated-DNA-[protein]-cysteine S-methyltransferase
MTEPSFTLFETALGACGILWSVRGIRGVILPEPTAERTRQRIARRFPKARQESPPPTVAQAIEAIVALLASGAGDLSGIAVDLEGVPEADRDLYSVIRSLGPGETLTYGEVAERLGGAWTARDVGAAMGRNPVPVIVPCHRVVAANGKLGGFSAPGGNDTKRRMLAVEQAVPKDRADLFSVAR